MTSPTTTTSPASWSTLFATAGDGAGLAAALLARLEALDADGGANGVSPRDLAARAAARARTLAAFRPAPGELVAIADAEPLQALVSALAAWSCGAVPVLGAAGGEGATGGASRLVLRGGAVHASETPAATLEAGLVVREDLVGAVAHPLATLGRLPLPEAAPAAVSILCDWRADAWLPLALQALAAGALVTLATETSALAPRADALLAAPAHRLDAAAARGWGALVSWGAAAPAGVPVPLAHGFGDHFVIAHCDGSGARVRPLDRHRVVNEAGRPLPENAWGVLALSGVLPERAETLCALTSPADRKLRTDLRARQRAEGLVEIDLAAGAPRRLHGRPLAPALLAAALADAGIAGGVALVRDAGGDDERIVVFAPGADVDLAALERALPSWAAPLSSAVVPSLPRLASGEVDAAALLAIAPPDTLLLARCEAGLGGADAPVRLRPGFDVETAPDLELPDAFVTPGPTYPARRPAQIDGPAFTVSSDDLIDRLLVAAEADRGLLFVDGAGAETALSYAALLEDAARVAAFLRTQGLAQGDELIVHCERPADLFAGIWAAILIGAIPLPLTPATPFDAPANPLWHLLGPGTMLSRRTVLASRAHVARMLPALAARGLPAEVLCIDDARASEPLPASAFSPAREALMLLTSGSTGAPKGVVLTHENLVSLSRAVGEAFGFGPVETSLNWLAIDHVGGLVQHHMRDLCRANTQIHVATDFILSDPVRMLDLVDRHRVSLLWMANFGFNMLAERAAEIAAGSWDLGCVKLWENGGEAVGFEGNQRFLALLTPHGLPGDVIKPVFGMTETTSACIGAHRLIAGAASGVHWLCDASLDAPARRGLPGESSSFAEVGVPFAGTSCRVVDAQGRTVPEGVVGRIEVRGAQIMAGYHNNPKANADTFTDDGWLRMGDCGFVADGQLVVTGREKEIVIINGLNHAARALEATIEAVPGIRRGACSAIGIRRADAAGDDLVVFYSLDDGVEDDPAAIDAALAAEHGLSPAACVRLAPQDWPRTAIGKIRRNPLSERFLAGDFADRITLRNARGIGERQQVPASTWVPGWVPASLEVPAARDAAGVLWLDAPTALPEALPGGLRARAGAPFAGFSAQGEARFDAADADDVARLLAAAAALAPLRRVVCAAFAHAPAPNDPEAALSVLETAGTRWRALCRAAESLPDAPLVVLATVGALQVDGHLDGHLDGSEAALGHAVLPGLAATLGQEHPRLRTTLVDGAGPGDLVAEPGDALRVAHRGGRRLVPRLRLVEATEIPAAPAPLRRGGRYVVVGGLGGVGSHLCRHLLSVLGADVVAVGRSAAEGGRGQVLGYLRAVAETAGGRIAYARCDVTDAAALAGLLAEACAEGPLDAVFNLAGEGSVAGGMAGGDAAEGALARAALRIRGTHALEVATEGRDVPVIGFGSVNGYFGGTGFAEYSAACSWQAAVAARAARAGGARRACLDWSLWKGTGMAAGASSDIRALARRRGFDSLAPAQALGSLHLALEAGAPNVLLGLHAAGEAVMPLAPPERLRARLDVSGTSDRAGLARRLGLNEARIHCRAAGAAADPQVSAAQVEALLAVFREILVQPELDADDNFFANGGDSIRAIQAVARATAIGLAFKPLDLFEHKTVRALLSDLARTNRLAAPAEETPAWDGAPVPVPPIFAWWLAGTRSEADRDAFSMSMRYGLAAGIGPDAVRDALLALVTRHDALRLRLLGDAETGWRLSREEDAAASLLFEIAPEGEGVVVEDWNAVERRLHGRLGIRSGPLVAASYRPAPNGEGAELLVVIHHGAVDGVSWRVVEEELRALLDPAAAAAPAPVAGIGYIDYAARLARRAATIDAGALADAWLARLDGPAGRLPGPADARALRDADTTIRSIRVPTSSLARLGDASLHEVLLTAVAWSLGEWMGLPCVVLDGEGHGRLDREMPADVSQTVGWFTAITPMRLDFGACTGPAEGLRATRAALEAARGRDLEWGLLRHAGLCPPSHPLAALPERQVSFNYLGSFDTAQAQAAAVRAVPDSLGAAQGDDARRRWLVDIAAQAIGAELEVSVKYSPACHADDEIAAWLEACERLLRDLLDQPAGLGVGQDLGLLDDDMLAALDEVTFG
ncbi:AMP-binding protein [Salinarimonas chemoclinalis]|uniref:AMP-binding protein n=1 Tax=Salinarimonas chemoclinalis TaxID=3241599 RepID=UPI0035588136